ncbi:MAG: hypothetical protein IKE95_03130 [Methanobrevibacter sp.]|nr:hypothetical protein [Methanobrevibacter sp.]
MKLKDLKNIFSKFTYVKLVVDGYVDVYQGYWYDTPSHYENYKVELIIPIRNPYNDKIGMASILIKYEE